MEERTGTSDHSRRKAKRRTLPRCRSFSSVSDFPTSGEDLETRTRELPDTPRQRTVSRASITDTTPSTRSPSVHSGRLSADSGVHMHQHQLSIEELISEFSKRLENADTAERKKLKLESENARLQEKVKQLEAQLKEKDTTIRIYADKITDIRRNFLASPPNETLKKLADIAKRMTLYVCESSSPDHTRPQTAPPFTRRIVVAPAPGSSSGGSGSDGDVETNSDSCCTLPSKYKRPPQQANTDVESGQEELVLPRLHQD